MLVAGAELTGEVQLRRTGLFQGQGPEAQVSLSLQPLEGQDWPQRTPPRQHRLLIKDRRLQPSFLTVRPGDSVLIENQDPVYHQLFSLSPEQPLDLHLGKRGEADAAQARVTLRSAASWHLFCRIHSRTYARIDAVDSHLLQTVAPGQAFRFEGIASGRWRLRVAALGAETRFVDTVALTAPPALKLTLTTKAGDESGSRAERPAQRRIEQLFPVDHARTPGP